MKVDDEGDDGRTFMWHEHEKFESNLIQMIIREEKTECGGGRTLSGREKVCER